MLRMHMFYQNALELFAAIMVFWPEYEPASVIAPGMLIAQSVSLDCGDVVEVVFGTLSAKKVGELEDVSAVAAAYATVEVANFWLFTGIVEVAAGRGCLVSQVSAPLQLVHIVSP